MVSSGSGYYTASNFIDDQTLGQDKSISIIIDFGIKLTKVGYAGEPEPRHILNSPECFNYEGYMREDTKKHVENREIDPNNLAERMAFSNDSISLISFTKDEKTIRYQMEQFINNILYK